MRVGILSDTHDQVDRTRSAVDALLSAGATTIFHCGDLTGPKVLALCTAVPCYFVFGNNDSDSVPDLRDAAKLTGATCLEWAGTVVLAGKRIAIAHGHMHTDIRRLRSQAPDYLLSGHSHEKEDRMEGATRRINPGALYRARQYSVALLDLETDDVQFLVVSRDLTPERTFRWDLPQG